MAFSHLASILAAVMAGICAEAPAVGAAEAAFSADGKEICFLAAGGANGVRIGATPTEAKELPSREAPRGRVLAVAASAPEGWLLLTAEALWRRHPGAREFSPWLRAEGKTRWNDVAVDPATENILLTGEKPADGSPGKAAVSQMYFRKVGRLLPVFSRRVGFVEGISFAPDGELFFGYRGDLWRGQIDPDEEDGKLERGVLVAARWVPLGYFETDVGTPSSTGVQAVAATSTHVFVDDYRIGGSGLGWGLRVPRPGPRPAVDAAAEKRGAEGARSEWTEAAEALRGITVLVDRSSGSPMAPAAARDGRVFYRDAEKFRLHRRPEAAAEGWGDAK